MTILFLIGDANEKSPDRQLSDAVRKLIGNDAQVIEYDGAPLRTLGTIDGLWIFAHDERGGCPETVMNFLTKNFSAIEDLPTVASGAGGKDGGMNAVTEIAEYVTEHGGRYHEDGEPLCIPMRSARFDPDPGQRMELRFLVDSFLKYCGMDESDSRRIGLETVIEDYFKILKSRSAERPERISFGERGEIVTDAGAFDWRDDLSPELRDLRYEIDELTEDYEIEADEILSALREKVKTDW